MWAAVLLFAAGLCTTGSAGADTARYRDGEVRKRRASDCSSEDVNERPGLCTEGTGMEFKYWSTLPSGGQDDQAKSKAALPGNTDSAIFFFKYDGSTGLPTVSGGVFGVDYIYECKKNAETTYVDCECKLPRTNAAPWEMCQSFAGLDRAGTMNFMVRAVALVERGGTSPSGKTLYKKASPIEASAPATFTWSVDTVPPVAYVGQYQAEDGTIVGAAPAPCSNPGDGVAQIEISANEENSQLQCRLSSWVTEYQDFDRALERWSADAVQAWLADPKHLTDQQVQLNLTQFASAFAGMAGSGLAAMDEATLRRPPYSIESSHDLSSTRKSILNAIDAQKLPFTSCRTERDVPALAKAYTADELGHGLRLFQVRAVDAAGNVGSPTDYIWFVDLEPPSATFLTTSPQYSQTSAITATWSGTEVTPTSISGAVFTDHAGAVQECDQYTFKTLLDGYDLTPRLIPGEAPPAPHRVASFADDVNSRAYTELNYLNYAGSLAPVELGEWRDFTLTVVPTDVAGNVAADGGVPFMWTIDMRAAITSITTAPEQLSSDSANIRFAWLSDEDGTTRKLTYQCAVDGGAPYECSRSGKDGGRGEYTIPQLPPPPPSGPYDPSKPAEAHNFTVLSVDEAGNAEQGVRLFDPSNPYSSFNAYSWLVDSRAPVATFTSPNEPAAYVSELEYAFRFESDENGGSFQCTLASAFPDGSSSTRVIQYETLGNGPLSGAVSFPQAIGGEKLADGVHTFSVAPVDLAGNVGDAISAEWMVDTVRPVTALVLPPSHSKDGRRTGEDYVEFNFRSKAGADDSPVSEFYCAIDCLRQVTKCSDAASFTIQAAAEVGNAAVCFPHNTPQRQPLWRAGNQTAVVAVFSGGDGETHTAMCSDSVGTAREPTYHPCTGGAQTYVGLHEGRHVFRVRAIDAAGNMGEPAVYGWDVDLTAPTASFQAGSASKPPVLTRSSTARFLMESDESAFTLQCRVQCAQRPEGSPLYQDMSGVEVSQLAFGSCAGRDSDFGACPNSVVLEGLKNAVHKFQVRAIDAVGNVQVKMGFDGIELGATTDYLWEVDQVSPRVQITTLPGSLTGVVDVSATATGNGGIFNGSITHKPAASFTFAADEPKVSFQCRRCIFLPDEDESEAWNAAVGCSIFGPCSGDGSTMWWNVWPSDLDVSAAVGMLPPQQGREVPVCDAAAVIGCTPVDIHPDASRVLCTAGYLRACGYAQFSFPNSVATPALTADNCADPPDDLSWTASEQLEAYGCVRTTMLRHVITVRAKDLAGNVGPEEEVRYLYDNIPPRIFGLDTSARQNPQGAVLLNPFLPKRPFAGLGNAGAAGTAADAGGSSSSSLSSGAAAGGVVSSVALDMYTQDTTMTFAWETDVTEKYAENKETQYTCAVRVGNDVVSDPAPCLSPFVLDGTTLPGSAMANRQQTRQADGVEVLRDGTYTFELVATDFSGNRGAPYTFTWTVDTSPPAVVFPATLPSEPEWSNRKTVSVSFLCTEPGCTFECQYELLLAPAARFAEPTVLPQVVVKPFHPCGTEKVNFAITFDGSATDDVDAKIKFVGSAAIDLAGTLQSMLAGFAVTSLSVDAVLGNDVRRVRAKFVVEMAAERASLSDALLSFQDGKVTVGQQYLGVSRFEVDSATGELCSCGGGGGSSCSNTQVQATCKDVDGKKVDCPCIEGYSGSGELSIYDFLYDDAGSEAEVDGGVTKVPPVVRDISALHPAGFEGAAATAEYKKYRLSVRATDAVGVRGAASHYDWHIDLSAPHTGFSALPTTEGPFAVLTEGTAGFKMVSDGLVDRGPSALSNSGESVRFRCKLRPLCWPDHPAAASGAETVCEGNAALTPAQVMVGHAWQPCQDHAPGSAMERWQEYSELPDGLYEFQVAAEDQAGNADVTPAAAKFVVDTAYPEASVLGFVVQGQRASVGFTASKAGCTFDCTLWHHAVNATPAIVRQDTCTSPYVVSGLPLGNITFEVVATDSNGRKSVPSSDLATAASIVFETTLIGENSTAVSQMSVACGETQDAQLRPLLTFIWILSAVAGLVLGVLQYLASKVVYPLGKSKATTRAFHNPAFGQDVPVNRRLSVSAPSNFQHVQSGMISDPSDFRHLAHHGRGASSPSFGLSTAQPEYADQMSEGSGYVSIASKMIKRNEAKSRARPSFPSAVKRPSIGAPVAGSFRHTGGYGMSANNGSGAGGGNYTPDIGGNESVGAGNSQKVTQL